uniref:Uncharacterized protein n=1 Tax=Arundo donax TaxID=35708 RepID=A0A0A9D9C7_ARUDO
MQKNIQKGACLHQYLARGTNISYLTIHQCFLPNILCVSFTKNDVKNSLFLGE